jgi:hypothetical protein
MKKLFSIMVAVWYLCFSTIASASGLENFLSNNNNAKKGYFKNISVYGVGKKENDKNYSGIGFKYDSDYTDFVLEKGEDYKKSSIVQRIDIDEMFYTKLGLGYLSIEEMIEGNNKFISQFSYGAELGYGNDKNYNLAFGYVANKLTKAGLANTTSKTIYTEAVIKQDTEIGSVDAVLVYQIAEAYNKKVSDYSLSLGYYPIDDIRMGAKYDSLDSDSNNYKVLAGVNYNFENLDNFSKGSWSPAVMLTSNVSENLSLFAEYRENISNRSLKIRDTFESQISTNEIVAKRINPEVYSQKVAKKETASAPANNAPLATDVSLDAGGGETIVHNLNANISDAEDSDSALTITVVSAPTHGSLVWSGNQFTYTVTDGSFYAGSDSFTYYVTDTNGSISDTKIVSIVDITDI